ncbi:epoxyqueuosine reductase [Halanaerobium hydrogeniformans]|uniref:Iron-sulfur cluster-binding protein n=1 Tax=Halanaerobium hydrogeniformans TaxID=656519 RepID=E4RPA2_HALHG|nr:epoxyqueuosine reductase [Halanaerobium hydrogeniformans]ADQ13787.1 hypothetical protein Halsa_0311 [Halanaerobium hydrogeniformans]
MKNKLKKIVKEYISEYQSDSDIKSSWREPLLEFAAADDPLFEDFKKIISPSHVLPEDILSGAKTVLAYFIPFSKEIVNSNLTGEYSSREWAVAYVETNQLIADLNQHLKKKLAEKGWQVSSIPATHHFDKERLISDWSHRHAAYAAGLAKFGINNMLITEKGCAGRVGTLITDLKIEPSQPIDKELCLNKAGENCQKCVDNCVNDSLKVDSFARFKCYEQLLKNDQFFSELGLTDVCGKCSVGLPCSFRAPL